MVSFLPRSLSGRYVGTQPLAMSMPKRLLGRSRTWPRQATTSKSGPRYLLMVLALAGDSTITRLFFFRAATMYPRFLVGCPQSAVHRQGLDECGGKRDAAFQGRRLKREG